MAGNPKGHPHLIVAGNTTCDQLLTNNGMKNSYECPNTVKRRCTRGLPSIIAVGSLLLAFAQFQAKATEDSCVAIPRTFGAAGDGIADDAAAINAALADGCHVVDGQGLTYKVGSVIMLQSNVEFRNATILSAIPANSKENDIIVASKQSNIRLTGIAINRGSDSYYAQNLGEDPFRAQLRTQAIYLDHVTGATLSDIDVYGDGVGSGIKLMASSNVDLIRPRVHDMRWAQRDPDPIYEPSNEVMVGIWSIVSTNVRVLDATVLNLSPAAIVYSTGKRQGKRNNMTDGVDSSGSTMLKIVGGEIAHVGEGLDFSGAHLTTNAFIENINVHDIDSFCYKAGSAKNVRYLNVIARNCGYAGIVLFTYPTARGDGYTPPTVTDVIIEGAMISDPGRNNNWSGYNIAGISIQRGGNYTPENVVIKNSRIIDHQEPHTMDYCLLNEPAPGQTILQLDNSCAGYLKQSSIGFR